MALTIFMASTLLGVILLQTGSGSAVAAIKFHPENASLVYTATLLSRVMLQDFGGAEPQVFWDTESER